MIEKKEIEPDEEPPRGTLWLKGRVNKDGEYPDDEIRSVGDKLVRKREVTQEEWEVELHTREGMVTKLKNQLAHGAVAVNVKSIDTTKLLTSSAALTSLSSLNHEYSADEESETTIFGCENDASIQKSNGLATLEKEMETR
ncbi:hypothetical protein Tco_1518685, partial [Tanacetum coccineum]